jgi:YVTN family beta-propeller protein
LDETRQRLYVLNRFDGTLSIVDTTAKAQVSQVSIGNNPEPSSVTNGRRFLYDAANFSAHGTVSCASCHPSGHRDGLAWDLGDPTGDLVTVGNFTHHPMKGPMMTQSLRGLLQSPPLHWRADRNNFGEFNIAFTGLLGSTRLLTTDEMNAYQTFIETMVYPPNPNENANRTFPDHPGGPNAQAGFDRFRSFRGLSDIFLGGAGNCNACHNSAPGVANLFSNGTARLVFNGTILSEPQAFKVPQLRGIYQKLGLNKPAPGQPRSEQLTGFGLMHDGAIDTLLNFMRQPDFIGFHNDDERREIEAFLMAFDSVIAPSVGLQVTVNASNKNSPEVLARVNLLIQRAQPVPVFGSSFPAAPDCDLVVRGIYGGAPRAFLQLGNGIFQPDSRSEATLTLQQLLSAVGEGSELTFTGVPEGEGRRYSIDRDGNSTFNDDEPRNSVRINGRVVDAAGNGIGGVAVTLSGKQSAAAVTDVSGNYVFNFVSTNGAHTVTPARAGLTFSPSNRSFTNPTWNQSATFISAASANVSDVSPFFVAQHYGDFLNRTPDPAGLQFWTDQIESCGGDADCRRLRRDNVSAAFFLSIEFKESGYLVYRAYKASFGDLPGKPVPVTFQQLMTDTERLGRNVIVNVGNWQGQIETNKQAFFVGWVQRGDFIARYPASLSPAAFVAALNANTGGSLTTGERDALVNQLTANNTTAGRAAVVRQVAENAEFSRRQINRAFVLMQYFGYLRRNPNDAPELGLNFDGFNFWLAKLDQFNGNFIQAEMVKAFITSGEYRQRFGQ